MNTILFSNKFDFRRGGRVWLNALVLKTSKGLYPSGVRIPPPPQPFPSDKEYLIYPDHHLFVNGLTCIGVVLNDLPFFLHFIFIGIRRDLRISLGIDLSRLSLVFYTIDHNEITIIRCCLHWNVLAKYLTLVTLSSFLTFTRDY